MTSEAIGKRSEDIDNQRTNSERKYGRGHGWNIILYRPSLHIRNYQNWADL